MKKTINSILLLSVVFSLNSCGTVNHKGDQLAALQDFNISIISLDGVDEIVFNGSQDVEIILEKSEDTPAVYGYYKVDSNSNKLVITPASKNQNELSNTILIKSSKLPHIILNGTGNSAINCQGFDDVNFITNSSGSTTFYGKSDHATIYANGLGSVDAEKFKVDILTFYLNGDGNSIVKALSQANVTLNGEGKVKVKGSPDLINKMGTYAHNIN